MAVIGFVTYRMQGEGDGEGYFTQFDLLDGCMVPLEMALAWIVGMAI